MKITQDDQGSLTIVDFPWYIGLFGYGLALVCAGRLIYVVSVGAYEARDLVGLTIAVLIGVFGGSAFAKRSTFIFDKKHRRLSWRRRGLLGRAVGGEFGFDEITEVSVQSKYLSTGGSRSHRVVLVTEDARIPVTEAYSLGEEDRCQEIVASIKAALG